MGLSNLLNGIYDSLFAPPGALDTGLITSELGGLNSDYSMLPDSPAVSDWTNGFGTLNPHEVPASGQDSLGCQGDLFGSGTDWQ